MTTQTTDIAVRYVAMWNETDPDARRSAIRELWAEDAAHILEAPQEMRDTAATIGFFAPALEARGRAALEARVKRAHEEFVASGEYFFRPRGDTIQLGRIRADYQFIER